MVNGDGLGEWAGAASGRCGGETEGYMGRGLMKKKHRDVASALIMKCLHANTFRTATHHHPFSTIGRSDDGR